jgi:hypothetical protein
MAVDLGSGVLMETSDINAGTGNYDSFLRIQNTGEEQGFNTDTSQQLDNKDGIFTHSLLIANLDVVTINGVDYYQIRLDLNEVNSSTGPNISLDELQLYYGDAANSFSDLASLTQVFDLSGSLALVDHNSGSGTDDYFFNIPVSLFAGADTGDYLTLYADFSGADGGFEEFRALSSEFVPQPEINIVKETNGTDNTCPNILTGEDVTWTYTVTNPGNIALSNVVVTDDNGTPGDTTDDFTANYVSGDTDNDGKLDTNETWIFSYTGAAGTGEYTNIASVTADWAFGESSGSVGPVSESDCYFGANPDLTIVKLTDGTDNQCPVLSVGESVTWTYNVTNSGNIGFADGDFTVTDDSGTPGDNTDDFSPDQVLSGGFNVGDLDTDGILDPGETWQYSATGTVVAGEYENTATVSADFTDDVGNSTTVTNSESDCYTGVQGCVRTPGFWQNPNNGGQFWDGIAGNEKNAGQEHFPTGELLYAVDSNHNGSIGAGDVAGLLIGDYNMNGLTDAGEDTLFISYNDARALINANNKQMADGVVKIGRDLVATWLNYLSGAGIGTVDSGDGAYSPKEAINDAINYLQIFGDSNASNAASSETFDTYSSSHHKVDTSSAFWNNNYPGGSVSGATIHSDLDGYNNTGTIDGIAYASSCDNEQLLTQLSGFSVNGHLTLNSII